MKSLKYEWNQSIAIKLTVKKYTSATSAPRKQLDSDALNPYNRPCIIKNMVNANSHTHGLVDAPAWRPKSKQWKRKNKANLKATAVALQDNLKAALAKGND